MFATEQMMMPKHNRVDIDIKLALIADTQCLPLHYFRLTPNNSCYRNFCSTSTNLTFYMLHSELRTHTLASMTSCKDNLVNRYSTRMSNHSGFCCRSRWQWWQMLLRDIAPVKSTPPTYHRHTVFLTGSMPFLLSNEQYQSTEGRNTA